MSSDRLDVGPDHPALARLKPGEGVLFLVVGPSGAGKDSLIAWVRAHAAAEGIGLGQVRRTVTRPADAKLEDHDSMDEAAFDAADAAGRFAVTWRAHGLRYGLPVSVSERLSAGEFLIANGSRQALPELRRVFDNLVTIQLEVKSEVLARRLAARGRESAADIERRLDRSRIATPQSADLIVVDNSTALEVAGQKMLAIIRVSHQLVAAGHRMVASADD